MRNYRLISGDSHINEPPDLWLSRAPAKFKDRAPRMERFPQGDAWILEGALDPINFGSNAAGGKPVAQNVTWCRWEDVRPGGYNPAERLKEQDQDGVDAEVLYPTPRISGALFWNTADPEFHLWQIRAYNDWLSEYCRYAPDRLVGLALMPNIGVEAAIAELRRARELPGIRGVQLGRYPSGGDALSEADEPFWAVAEALEMPVSIHVSLISGPAADKSRSKFSSGEFRFLEAPQRIAEFIYSGTFDRYPRLQLVLAEVDCAWVPYVKEQMDDRYRRMPPERRHRNKLTPSAYFDRHLYYTYITDSHGIRNRKYVGVDRILWSSDYPHSGTDWPHSWDTINRDFAGVPEDEKQAILAGNAARLYRLDGKGGERDEE